MAIKAVALDMVGVILDEERIVSKALWEMLPEPRRVPKNILKERYDSGLRLGKLRPDEFWSGVADEPWEDLEERFLASLRLTEGALDTIPRLAERYVVFVVSDLPERWATSVLTDRGLAHYIAGGAFADQHKGARKKDGALLRVVVQEVNRDASEIVLVDDTADNVRAADQVGMQAIWFAREGREAPDLTDRTVSGFGELEAALGRLG